MKVPVILESPYAGQVQRNKAYLQLCILDCLARGESPFASHQMFTEALDDSVAEERALGIAAAGPWFETAKRVVVYSDLGFSHEMYKAVATANLLSLPVEIRTLPQFDLEAFYTDYDRHCDTPWEELFARAKQR